MLKLWIHYDYENAFEIYFFFNFKQTCENQCGYTAKLQWNSSSAVT